MSEFDKPLDDSPEQPGDLNAEFRAKFEALMRDMGTNVQNDARMLNLLGATANSITSQHNTKGWVDMKRRMNEKDFNRLLGYFRDSGNVAFRKGDKKRAYAYEILAISLIARNMHADKVMKMGDTMLDQMIEQTIALHRRGGARTPQQRAELIKRAKEKQAAEQAAEQAQDDGEKQN